MPTTRGPAKSAITLDKAVEIRVKEIDLRLLELQVEEEKCWQDVANLRRERAVINLERHNLLNPPPKK